MQIIAHAKTVIDTVGMPDELKASLKDGLDDAYSTIAALNLNPNIFERTKALEKSLTVMTSLCRIKYGNLDKDVYAEIEKAEQLLNSKP